MIVRTIFNLWIGADLAIASVWRIQLRMATPESDEDLCHVGKLVDLRQMKGKGQVFENQSESPPHTRL